jgi:hypothetical protein
MQAVDFDLHAGKHLMVDACKIKVGDMVKTRGGKWTLVKAVSHLENPNYAVALTLDGFGATCFTKDGHYWDDGEHAFDIVEIKEKLMVSMHKLKRGSSVTLRNGKKKEVFDVEYSLELGGDIYPYIVTFVGEDEVQEYTPDGLFLADARYGYDIVEIHGVVEDDGFISVRPSFDDDPSVEIPKFDEDELEDIINRPSHYTDYKIEPVTFVMENRLPFEVGNIVKYACRAGKKLYPNQDATQSRITDMRKVIRYAEMEINRLEGKDVL